MAVTINGSTGIELTDSDKQLFGTGDDLEIYHNGSHSYIKNTGTGNLYIEDTGTIRINTDSFAVQKNDGSESIITGTADGDVELYYDNVKKLETANAGIIVAGYVNAQGDNGYAYICNDNLKSSWGTGLDLEIYHDGSNSYIKDTGTGSLCILGSEIQLTNAANTENLAVFENDGPCKLFHDGVKVFETHANGGFIYGPEGGVASLYFYSDEGDDNADKWRIINNNSSYFRLESKDSGSWVTHTESTNSWFLINSVETNQGSSPFKIKKNDAASNVQSTMITFEVGDQGRGQIVSASADGGSPQFSSWSDRRLKTNFRTYTGGYDKIKAIPVKLYDEVRTGQKDRVGWIADEFQTVFPEAVQGTKDAVDSDNNPVYQTLAAGTIFPDLVQALQAAITKIETLETKVAALEAA